MLNISEFFKRIGGVQAKEVAKRDAIRVAIKQFIDIDVPITSISFKSTVANLKDVSQTAKSVIYMKKKAILDRANTIYGSIIASDIR
jgi:methylphosphotriester-DNA--protein-cysteine methyltransferase